MLKKISAAVRAAAGVLVLALALGIVFALVATRPQVIEAPSANVPLRVRVVEITPVEAPRVWEGFGTARAMRAADVSAEVTARVTERPGSIEAGVPVSAGDLLLRLDDGDFALRAQSAQSNIDAIEAELAALDVEQRRLGEQIEQMDEQVALLEWELERYAEAGARGAAAESEVNRLRRDLNAARRERLVIAQTLDIIPARRDRFRADLASARSQLATAQRDIERASIRSPIDGVLQRVGPREGDLVTQGAAVARVVDLSRLEIPITVGASAHGRLRVGDIAAVRPVGPGESRWEARVSRIGPEADPATRSITVYLELDQSRAAALAAQASNPAPLRPLLPGRFVTAQLREAAPQARPIVPRGAVNESRVMVAVEENGVLRARPREVDVAFYTDGEYPQLDRRETQWAVIASGLEPGELVIVSNLDELAPGIAVEAIPAGRGGGG